MADFIRILTQKHRGAAHAETKITIDWEGITHDELVILARRALIYQFQIGVQKDLIPGVPEAAHFIAREHARDRTPIIEVVFAPKAQVKKPIEEPSIADMVAALTPEERRLLFAEVSGE